MAWLRFAAATGAAIALGTLAGCPSADTNALGVPNLEQRPDMSIQTDTNPAGAAYIANLNATLAAQGDSGDVRVTTSENSVNTVPSTLSSALILPDGRSILDLWNGGSASPGSPPPSAGDGAPPNDPPPSDPPPSDPPSNLLGPDAVCHFGDTAGTLHVVMSGLWENNVPFDNYEVHSCLDADGRLYAIQVFFPEYLDVLVPFESVGQTVHYSFGYADWDRYEFNATLRSLTQGNGADEAVVDFDFTTGDTTNGYNGVGTQSVQVTYGESSIEIVAQTHIAGEYHVTNWIETIHTTYTIDLTYTGTLQPY